jgi:hypothetical protein
MERRRHLQVALSLILRIKRIGSIDQIAARRRRVDVVEFFDFAKAFGITPRELFDRVDRR